MKKTKVMSIIAMVFFILALFWELMDETIYYIQAVKYSFDGGIIARAVLTNSIPSIAAFILMIIGVRLAASSKNKMIYPIAFFIYAAIMCINLVIDIIELLNNHSPLNMEFYIRQILTLSGFVLIGIDAVLLKRNKAFGIIGAAVIIAVAIIYLFYYSFQIASDPLNDSDAFVLMVNIMTILSYYSMLQCIGIGALLYAIGRQPKDVPNIPAPPSYPNGGNGGNGGQFNNQYNYQPPQTPDQNNYQPPQTPYQDNYQPPQTPDRNNYQPPYNQN